MWSSSSPAPCPSRSVRCAVCGRGISIPRRKGCTTPGGVCRKQVAQLLEDDRLPHAVCVDETPHARTAPGAALRCTVSRILLPSGAECRIERLAGNTVFIGQPGLLLAGRCPAPDLRELRRCQRWL